MTAEPSGTASAEADYGPVRAEEFELLRESRDAIGALVRLGDYVTPIALRVLVELGIPDRLAGGPRTAEELAAECEADPDSLYRMLRALTANQIVHETRDHRFELTAISQLLRTDHPFSFAGMYRLAVADIQAVAELEWGVRHPESAFEHVHGQTFWDYNRADDTHLDRYEDNMWAMARMEIAAVVELFDWRGVEHFVDMGGGTGQFLAGILQARPDVRGTMIDLPAVAPGAWPVLHRAGVAERVEVVSGDFFVEVPGGGDAYLLKRVFYDFSDEQCIAVLRNVRAAMNDDARVLILDGMVRSDNRFDFGKLHDLYVLAMGRGRCRTRDELQAICAAAGLEVHRVMPTGGFPLLIARAAR